MKKIPETGTVMWFVVEHFYREPGKCAPVLEYCVVSGPVEPWSLGIKIRKKVHDNLTSLHYFSAGEIGKIVFFSAREAAARAKDLTEQYERSCLGASSAPLRRTWEIYMHNKEGL